MFRPLRNVMADRELYIERVKLDIDQARKKIETMTSQIREQESEVKKEAFELKGQPAGQRNFCGCAPGDCRNQRQSSKRYRYQDFRGATITENGIRSAGDTHN